MVHTPETIRIKYFLDMLVNRRVPVMLIGGAGCGKCGGISCLDGALSKAGEAVKSAELADKLLREKDAEAQQVLKFH